MIKRFILFCLSSVVSIASILVNRSNDYVDNDMECPNSYMTESVFNSDFAYCMVTPNVSLLSNERISYFYNLYNYSPENSHGSCGYVSFIQYLSYYDCFYNDSIIPESYERNQGDVTSLNQARAISPGVLRQTYPGSSTDLYSFTQNNMTIDYQMKLMHVVNEDMGHSSNQYSYSIGMWDYYRIINSISAFSNTSFEYTRVQDFGSTAKPTDSNVINFFDTFVKTQLDLGNPVMLHIAHYNQNNGSYDNYHSIVAYYYDNDGIHANFGWGSTSTDVIISNYYQITEAGVINFNNVLETHSNNFHVNHGKYCGCGLHTEHGYCDHYALHSSEKHKAYCACGEYVLRPHAVETGNTHTIHVHTYANCIDCGALVDLGTTVVIVKGIDN